jgi:hypothetical protein
VLLIGGAVLPSVRLQIVYLVNFLLANFMQLKRCRLYHSEFHDSTALLKTPAG